MSKDLVEHDLTREVRAAQDLLTIISDAVGDDDQAAADMIEGETSLFEALDRAISEIKNCEIMSVGCADAIDTLTARKRRADNRKGVIRAAIEQAMATVDLKTVQRPTATLTISHRAGKAIITEESEIPARFFKPQAPKLDLKALTDALKAESVPGAHLGNGTISLTIREK